MVVIVIVVVAIAVVRTLSFQLFTFRRDCGVIGYERVDGRAKERR